MNTWNKIRLKRVLTFLLAGCLLAAGSVLCAQNPKKKKAEEIPEEALRPAYSDFYIKQKINKFTEWITAGYKPTFAGREVRVKDPNAKVPELSPKEVKRLKAEAKKAGRKYEPPKAPEIVYTLSRDEFRRELLSLKMLFSKPENLDDIEEVTGVRRQWYLDLIKSAEGIGKPIAVLERAYDASNEEYYEEVFKDFKKAVEAFEKQAKSRQEKLSAAEMKSLNGKNLMRRRAAYFKRKKAEQAKEAAGTSPKKGTDK